MKNKCPPGIICIENFTFLIIIFILIVIFYYIYFILNLENKKKYNYVNNKNNNKTNNIINTGNNNSNGLFPKPSYSFSNVDNDILLNPYEGPLIDNRIFPNTNLQFKNKIPINIETQSFDSSYRQIGILTRHGNSQETILPLMGRPLIANREKWNFYAMSDKNNMIKLNVSTIGNSNCAGVNNYKNCMTNVGCDDLYNGDLVKVDGYNDLFKVIIYENNSQKYIPYI